MTAALSESEALKMDIAIVDADLMNHGQHKFPNLACMKMSGFYKEQGHNVRLVLKYVELFETKYDLILLLKAPSYGQHYT